MALCSTTESSDSDYDSSSDSDFNFGDLNDFNQHIVENKNEEKGNDIETLYNCNLNVIEPKWFMINDGKEQEQEPTKVHRNNKILKSMRYKCELFYAQRKYQDALILIEDIFIQFDIDSKNQFGNELIDILIRCLCKSDDFENALKQIDKLLVRDVSFGTMELITNIYNETKKFNKGFKYAINLTKKEPLNPICWYHLSICSKNIKNYDFCFVCLRLLQFNVNFYSRIDRYSKSKLYTNKLLNYAKYQMDEIKQYLNNPQIETHRLSDIFKLFDNDGGNENLLNFLQTACKRFNFNSLGSLTQNGNIDNSDICHESFVNEIDDLLLHNKIHATAITNDIK